MILSRGRGYLFIHIPKTGGTALTRALEARARADDVIVADTPKGRARAARQKGLPVRGRLWKHALLADLDGWLDEEEIAGLFTRTLVRNPWDRLVSYYHWLRAQEFAHPHLALAQSCDFSAFLNDPDLAASLRAHPARRYMTTAAGAERATLYARLEHLDQDLGPFEAHLGFSLTPLPFENRSERPRDWRGLYSDADAALVADIAAEDIARFGYRFDP